ncbi:MAG TPA: hypothetical protein VFJ82_04155 [Longimicrobium sp.]|nr:hypothetical protein [Longimicrobium sp.]
MSTPAVHIADPTVAPKLEQMVQPVTVVHGDTAIGRGELVTTPVSINVRGSYQWPPDAPAEIPFTFDFVIHTQNTCDVAVDWPGLVPEIPKTLSSYFMVLVLARPGFLITTPAGDHVNATFMGPPHQPEITNALSVAVTTANGAASRSLVFQYDSRS